MRNKRMIQVSSSYMVNGIINVTFSDSIEISSASTEDHINDIKQSLLNSNLKSIKKLIDETKEI